MIYYVYIMKMPQGNPHVSTLNKQKCNFSLIFVLYKIGEQEGRIGPAWGFGTSGRMEEVGVMLKQGEYGEILHIQVSKWKNDIC
jgi:hypothetical protein